MSQSPGSSGSSLQSQRGAVKYVYELPFFERKEICRIFDENNQWETLGGGFMGYSTSELGEFGRAVYRGASPTDALLTAWGNQNHTVLELFTICARMYHSRAMKVVAKYVDEKYHTFIHDPDFHATQELAGLALEPSPEAQKASPLKGAEGGLLLKDGDKEGGKKKEGTTLTLSEAAGLLPQISYADLTAATNDWDKRNILGKGGFGTVYKGIWKNTAVAIKRMEQQRPVNHEAYAESQMRQSLGEMRFLNSYRHDNVLPLYGFCLEGQFPCLVYQFMTNGSLEDRILCRQRTPPLSWPLRFHVAKGVACGIQFLHSIGAQPLIHGDIKSANILLDKNYEPKVGDFGLAREMARSDASASYVKVSRVHGTRPYLPDEYLRSKKLSTKVDSYSFGIVLFELATGQRAYEEQRPKKFLKDLVEDCDNPEKLKDLKPGVNEHSDIFQILLNLGKLCTEKIPKRRPEMVEVLKQMEQLHVSHPQSLGSFRTHSVVTGLPYLFETPTRPGSLGIPVVPSSSTNRHSPEMRVGSPHWFSPVQSGLPSPSGGFPSPGGVRKISQTSNLYGGGQSPLPQPLTPVVEGRPLPVPQPTSNSNNLLPLTVDTARVTPELCLIQPSPLGAHIAPIPVQIDHLPPPPEAEEELYLPVMLEEQGRGGEGGGSGGEVETVIPLITELGIKKDS